MADYRGMIVTGTCPSVQVSSDTATLSAIERRRLREHPIRRWPAEFLRHADRRPDGCLWLHVPAQQYRDPQTGRFAQEDPLGLAGGTNAYGFANADPINYDDPFGLCPKDQLGNCTQSDVAPTDNSTKVSTLQRIIDRISGAIGSLGGDPAGSSGGSRAGMPFLKWVRERIRGPEGNACRYCGRPTTRASGPEQSQAEHVIPKAKGGNGDETNGVNACRVCNLDKGARTPEEWTPRWYQKFGKGGEPGELPIELPPIEF